MNFKNLSKKITAFALSAFTVLTLAGGVLQSVSANGGSGSGGSGGGQVTGDNPGYTVWFDQWGADGEPAQGWGEASMNNMQARIEGMLGKTMNPNAYGGTRPYLEIYQQAAREALADAQARSATGRARIVGVTSIYWDGGDNMQAAYDSKANVMRLAGTRPGTVDELPDNTGWSTTYNNGDGANGTNWRDWLEQYGVAKAADTNLTMIVWAVAEGEPVIPEVDIEVTKLNTLPALTQGNNCYAQDLSGAEYEVHKNADLSDAPVYTLVTDANGYAKTPQKLDISQTTYYVKETKAPKGFALDPTVYTVSVGRQNSWKITSNETPLNDPMAITLVKKSAEGIENPAPLEGAEFTLKYYDGQFDFDTLPATPTRTWVFKTTKSTNGEYRMIFGANSFVRGDELYMHPVTQTPILPLGTITVEETKAPAGYTLDNKFLNGENTDVKSKNGVVLFNIVDEASTSHLVGGNEYTVNEGVKRGGFTVKKTDRETGEALANAEFKILNPNDYDVKYVHEDGTSEVISAGQLSESTITTDENGSYTSSPEALQAGKYALIETKAPNGYYINERTDFEIKDNGNAETEVTAISVLESKIHTRASVEETGTNVADGSKTEQTLKDTVEYHDLIVGKEYTFETEWAIKPAGYSTEELQKMDSATFERVKGLDGNVIKTITTFTPTSPDGEIEVSVKFDPSKYAGKKLVAFEDAYKDGLLVGHHADITDKSQTVTVSMDVELTVVKADKNDTNKFLKGAEFTVFNQDGTVAKTKDGKDAIGVTDENGKVAFKLEYDQDNQMYVKETKAPEGYTLSDEKFNIERTNKDVLGVDNVSITVLDDKVPPTGVVSHLALYAVVGVVALGGLYIVLSKKKEEK